MPEPTEGYTNEPWVADFDFGVVRKSKHGSPIATIVTGYLPEAQANVDSLVTRPV